MNFSDFLLFYAKSGVLEPLRKSCYRKYCRRNRGQSFLVKTRYGSTMKIVIGDNVDNEIFLKKYFELGTSELMVKLTKLSDCFVDVGCNIGYYSCLFGKLNPNAKVFSIDPNPQMIERTTENMKLNELTNFKTYNYGVSYEENTLKFYIPQRRHSLGSFIKPEKDLGEIKTLDVPVRSLMDILNPQDVENAVLKIDAEGYEWKILSGLSISDIQKFNYVIFEFASEHVKNAGNSAADIFEIPWFNDYQLYSIESDGSIKPFAYEKGIQYSLNIFMTKKGAKAVV
ncbi:MAG TPA: FkbM family methyltransferase [Anaerohalosphaeraceae bacterium]|nr:FkbM family methyltransferase [Phycisphaerae bacterium]HPC65586.1 FkbM family methyltransferase [Anaerohalosphaeraceae bacterium]